MKHLSIIVPMYNVAPYVERCIRSLEEQDIPKDEYEIICVNDGSPDNCGEIVERLQQEYSNIILINQENQGVSRARNNGIELANGKYLLFVDPDDYVDSHSFLGILKTAEANRAQVSFLGYTVLNVEGTIQRRILNEKEKGKVVRGAEAYFLARGDGRTDPDRMWAVLFEREFMNLHKLRYLPDVPYLEDGELIARIMCLAERCMFYGHSFYQRTTRPGSATNSRLIHSEKAINGFINAALALKQFQQSETLNMDQKTFLNKPIAKFTILALTPFVKELNYVGFYKKYKELKRFELIKLEVNGLSPGYRKRANSLNKSSFQFLSFSYYRLQDKLRSRRNSLKVLKPY